jgi:bacteriocin-type transport-associated protein
VGESVLLDTRPSSTTIKAIEKSLVLSIPQQQLTAKLQQDISFAAHFYRALAILLSERLRDMVNQLGSHKLAQDASMKRGLFIFGELSDRDIDWMNIAGHQEAIAPGQVLIEQGIPTDSLYIILDGSMSVYVSDGDRNPLSRAFAALDSTASTLREIAQLTSGQIVGEMPFVDSRPPSTTVKAIQKSLVLSLPRQQLIIKLQQDVGFASRFYRLLASLLSDRLRDLVSRIGFGRRVYSKGAALDEDIKL